MLIYITLVIFLIFVIYKERQALGCPNWPDGSDCDNANGKAVKGSKVSEDMSTKQILDAIDYASGFQTRWVKWRAVFLTAIASAIAIIYVMHDRFPTEREIITFVIVIMLILTLVNSFYRFHLSDHVTNHISEGVDILRQRLK